MSTAVRDLLRSVARHPSAVLLVVQLVGVLLYPFAESLSWGRGLFELFGALVLGLAVWSVRDSPGPTWVAIILGVSASALSVAEAVSPNPTVALISAVLHGLFYFWAAGNLMGYMLADATVTRDELYAVGATFTLVAWAFAYVFTVLQTLQPGALTESVDPQAQRTWMELLFLSFTNLSGTGLSDIVPITSHARSVVMIQQLAGLGYIALFVSRLVGLTIARQRASTAGPRADEAAAPHAHEAAKPRE